MKLEDFCSEKQTFITELVSVIHNYKHELDIEESQVVIIRPIMCEYNGVQIEEIERVKVDIYFRDIDGKLDITLTQDCAKVIKPGFQSNAESNFRQKVCNINIFVYLKGHGTSFFSLARLQLLKKGKKIINASARRATYDCLLVISLTCHT